ncbi:ABC transporter substrate-binding protein [Candidatus Protochlamydia phocaeensis]|uniref:ABC transporter substrate-binding protein n=1 Tax=Candidatus Protochlamydia phocaeensis TaxID=1414722 RepID=UPI000837D8FE|nr:ABC transporter substrate-binding protein [Candidatus Protochlamydia phocaeensis]
MLKKKIFLNILFFLLTSSFLVAKEKTVIRIGHFATVTHAQAVIGHGLTRESKGWFENYLGPDIELQWFVYSDGPSAMEALFADSIDLTYVGPSPTINAYVRAKGQHIRIVCGACSGGSALVVQPDRIESVADFKGKKIATPQLGNTQDVMARAWLYSKGFQFNLFGGDVTVLPMNGVDQLTLFQQRDLDAAWTVEPWVSRLVIEAKGKVFLEESDLWALTGGKYITTHLVCNESFLKKQADLVKKWILAHIELTEWIEAYEAKAKALFNEEIKRETFVSLSPAVLDRAWKQINLTYAPIQASLYRYADWAYELGFLKQEPQLEHIYDLHLLREVLDEKETFKKKMLPLQIKRTP